MPGYLGSYDLVLWSAPTVLTLPGRPEAAHRSSARRSQCWPSRFCLGWLARSLTTWQNAVALSIQPGQLHNYRDTTKVLQRLKLSRSSRRRSESSNAVVSRSEPALSEPSFRLSPGSERFSDLKEGWWGEFLVFAHGVVGAFLINRAVFGRKPLVKAGTGQSSLR